MAPKEEVLILKEEEFFKSPPLIFFESFFEPYEHPESVLPDGKINPECPCLHSALAHRCGYFIREAIKCFNSSSTNPRGLDCEKQFLEHFMCMEKYSN
ncbi:unnamed protein product [Caenorhabditis auriculariae]|uniref:CHCH domain-containing protein n=1 Tax=Caenorhabditis auriculariae TaxID=2777116 RepID=A0A8S1HNA6_9PELO|nr:unnamed protein product [Caenorhabditis auriculariae]